MKIKFPKRKNKTLKKCIEWVSGQIDHLAVSEYTSLKKIVCCIPSRCLTPQGKRRQIQRNTTCILSLFHKTLAMAASIVENVLARASAEEAESLKSTQVDKAVDLEYDVGNLLAYDFNDIDLNQLR